MGSLEPMLLWLLTDEFTHLVRDAAFDVSRTKQILSERKMF
jgi:hypothetical protein